MPGKSGWGWQAMLIPTKKCQMRMGGSRFQTSNDKALFVVLIREHDYAKVVLHGGCADTILLLLRVMIQHGICGCIA